jgi:hypothetical protein
MSISPTCDACGKELTEFGAILLGPPDTNDMAKKWHICKPCYSVIEKDLLSKNEPTS